MLLNPCTTCTASDCSTGCPVANATVNANPEEEAKLPKNSLDLDERLKLVLKDAGIKTPQAPRAQIVITRGINFLLIKATGRPETKIKNYSEGLKGRIVLCYRSGVLTKVVYHKK